MTLVSAGNTSKSMAAAVENAAVFVPVLTEKYKASPAARQGITLLKYVNNQFIACYWLLLYYIIWKESCWNMVSSDYLVFSVIVSLTYLLVSLHTKIHSYMLLQLHHGNSHDTLILSWFSVTVRKQSTRSMRHLCAMETTFATDGVALSHRPCFPVASYAEIFAVELP